MSDKVFVGPKTAALDTSPAFEPISKVVILLDEENAYEAGEDSGRTVEITCPYGTQEMANNLLASLGGYVYKPLQAQDVLIDPAAELGDAVTVGRAYTVLGQMALTFDSMLAGDIGAPGQEELESEYKFQSTNLSKINRKIATTRSLITKTAEQIRLEVRNDLQDLSASITVELNKITSEVQGLDGQVSTLEQTAERLTARITDAEGNISSIEQYVDSITLSVANGETSSTITLKAGSATIASQTIQMNGLVTFTGLEAGTTVINGACIQTGTIDAQYLNLTGAITFNDLSNSLQGDIDDAYYMAENAQSLANDVGDTVDSWTYSGTTYIDGTKLMTGTVMATQLLGGTVGLLDASERTVGGLEITYTNSGFGLELYTNTGGLRLTADGDFWVDAQYGSFGITSSGLVCGYNIVPLTDGQFSVGTYSFPWMDAYFDNDPIIGSDRKIKTAISYGLDRYGTFFDRLRPVSYKLKNGSSGRTHLGLISQDVEQALADSGLNDMDFAGFIKSPCLDENGQAIEGEYKYALRYGETIALLIDQVQKLKERVAELESAQTGGNL